MSNRNRFFSSSNPFLTEERYAQSANQQRVTMQQNGRIAAVSHDAMTIQGAVNKTFLLTGVLFITALASYSMALANPALIMPFAIIGMIGSLVLGLIAYMRPTSAPIVSMLYAVVEGLSIGAISLVYALKTSDAGNPLANPNAGIIFQALMLTVLCLVAMLGLYKAGIIRATEKFRAILFTATAAIAMLYLVSLVLRLATGSPIPYLHEGGIVGIGLSLIITGVAALNLILDFDNFERGEEMQAPKYMEWLSAMGLLVTLVWLYIEILRLLSKFSSND